MWIAVTFFLWTITVSMENPAQIYFYFLFFSIVFVFLRLSFSVQNLVYVLLINIQ